jgi:succinoglycan biosynthesis transport protein ExoP
MNSPYHAAPLHAPPEGSFAQMASSPLRQYLGLLLRSRDLIIGSLAVSLLLATAYNYGSRPIYEATAVVSIDDSAVASLKVRATVDQARKMSALAEQVRALKSNEVALLAVKNLDPIVAAELARGPLGDWRDRIVEEVRYQLGFPTVHGTTPTNLVTAYRSRLSAHFEPPASWVYLRFQGYDAESAARAANHLAETYLAEVARQTAGAAGASRLRMDEKVAERQGEASETLGKLQSLEAREGLQAAQSRRELLEKELARLQDSLVAVRQVRLARRALLEETRRLSGNEMLTIPSIRDDSVVAESVKRIAEIESRLSRAAATLGDRHPDIVGFQEELDAERRRLNGRIADLREAIARDERLAQREEAQIVAALEAAQRSLPDVEKNAIERSFIQKEAEAQQRAVGEIIDKSVREAGEDQFFSPKLIQRATTPTVPISPQRARNVQYALAIGLALGLALVWLRSALDETLKTPEEVKASIAAPLLGMVPHVDGSSFDLLAREGPSSTRLLEAYRVLRTNLTQGDETLRANPLILVTSSREGEGKTTTSCGLGVTLARAGKKVLLIDGDLRRASLSKLLSATGRAGLTNVAEGSQIRACLTPTSVTGLTLLASGRLRPNPAEILNQASLITAIESIRSEYDWIICDAPPVLAVADAAILSRLADAVIVVIGANSTPLGTIRATLDHLAAVSARLRGVVLNNVDLRRDSHYYSYYYSARYSDYEGTPRTSPAKGVRGSLR